jgi:hypothetical protein
MTSVVAGTPDISSTYVSPSRTGGRADRTTGEGKRQHGRARSLNSGGPAAAHRSDQSTTLAKTGMCKNNDIEWPTEDVQSCITFSAGRSTSIPSYILHPSEAEYTATCVYTCTSCLHTASTAYTYSIVSPATIFSLRRNVLLMVVRCYAVSPSTLLLNLPRPFMLARAETCRPS